MKIIARISIIIYLSFFALLGQEVRIDKVEPPNWWEGMHLNKIQLMIYGRNLHNFEASFSNPDIKVLKIHKILNPDYAFIDIEIPNGITPGTYKLILKSNSKSAEINFPVLQREPAAGKYEGFNNSDAIYLIFPDRFADGDPLNNNVEGMLNEYDRSDGGKRHGGDLQGIIGKLDYIKDMGFTAIWINPILENNTAGSYHGYAATDLYKVDPRLGSNGLYKQLVDEAHKRGMKVIFDHVANHISDKHPWMSDVPAAEWFNGTREKHFPTTHNKIALADIHRSEKTLCDMEKGWFAESMPDLNQCNPFVANYLIENMIWWMEYSGLDGIREDTYPFPNQNFMSKWDKAILDEYPKTNIVGEVWTEDASTLSYYQKDTPYKRAYNSYLPTIMDFASLFSIQDFLSGAKGLSNVYDVFAKDFVYANPDNILIFADNHDHQRGMFAAKGNSAKMKLALTLVMTTRGIPQVLYGTEIGMKGGQEHTQLRMDFPGGFPGDKRDAFTAEGRTKDENDMFNHISRLLHLRQEYKAISIGKFTHFPPEDEIYYYTKSLGNEKILFVINGNKNSREVNFKQVLHLIAGKSLVDIYGDDKPVNCINDFAVTIPPYMWKIYKIQ